jgi:hypothetical protein
MESVMEKEIEQILDENISIVYDTMAQCYCELDSKNDAVKALATYIEGREKERALDFDRWLRIESGCTYTTGVFWRNEKGERVLIQNLYESYISTLTDQPGENQVKL